METEIDYIPLDTEDVLNSNLDDPNRHNIGGSMNRPVRNADPLAPRNYVMDKQVAGDHYNTKLLQPWDIIDEYGLNFYEGNMLKYLLRRKNDRVTDLEKLIHYAEKEIENVKQNT